MAGCSGQIRVSTAKKTLLDWSNTSPANGKNLSDYTMRGSCNENITSFKITSPAPEQVVECKDKSWSISLDLTGQPDGPIMIVTDLKDPSTGKNIEFETFKDTTRPSGLLSSTLITSNAKEVEVDVHFAENVIGLPTDALIALNAQIRGVRGEGQDFKVKLAPEGQGSFSLQIKENAVFDLAGNANTESNLLSLLHDSQIPTVTLTSDASEFDTLSIIAITATFSEQVIDFDQSMIQLTNGVLSNFTQNANAYTFNVAPSAEGEVQIIIPQKVTHDGAGNSNEESKLTLHYDYTPPSIGISSTLVESIHLPGEEIPFFWSILDANRAESVQLSYSIDGGTTWIDLGILPATPSEYNWTAPNVDSDDIHFKIVGKDKAGNESSAQVGPFTINNNFISPSLTLTPSPDFTQKVFYGGQTVNFNYSSSGDNLIENKVRIEISFNEGVNWTTLLSNAPLAGSYAYTIPAGIDKNPVYFRLQNENLREEIGTIFSPHFIIDNSPPKLTSIQINDGGGYAITPFLGVTIEVEDSSDVYVSLAEIPVASSCADHENGSGHPLNPTWRKWDNNVELMSLSFQVTPNDGAKRICAWAKDGLDRMAAAPLSSTVILESRYIPILSQFDVYQEIPGKFTAAANEPITINYSATDNEGLSKNPLSFAYTLDGSTWLDVETQLDIQNPQNVTWMHSNESLDVSVSGTYTFTSPSSDFFRIQGRAKDRAGNISIVGLSNTFNSGNWQVYLGSKDRGEGGVGKGVAITENWSSSFFAIHPHTGDFYFIEREWGLRKLDIRTGLVSTVVKLFNQDFSTTFPENLMLKGTEVIDFDNAISRVYSGSVIDIDFDSKGRLYLVNSIFSTSEVGRGIIYQVDLEAKTIRPYAGGGTNFTSENPFDRVVLAGSIAFDEKDNLYLWESCVYPVTSNNVAKRILKISQKNDSTPGNLSVVFGGACQYENPTIGSSASSSKSGTIPLVSLSSITPINENSFYLTAYGGLPPIKVVNGIIRSVSATGISGNTNTNRMIYNKHDGYLYATSSSEGVTRFKPSLAGNGGEAAQESYLPAAFTAGCQEDGRARTSACIKVAQTLKLDGEGNLFFTDGPGINKPTNARIRYVNRSGEIDTLLGTRPLFGLGMDKSLTRGQIGSIAYKRSSLNTTLFPQGLYFMVPNGMVMAYVQPTDKVAAIWGNQSGQPASVSVGITSTVPSPLISMGTPYKNYNGNFLVFDDNGLPWLRTQMALTTVTSSGKIEYLQPDGGPFFNARPLNATARSISMYVDAGASNLNVFERKAIFFGGYYELSGTHIDNFSEMILLDFSSNSIKSLMGRESGVLIRDMPEPVFEGTNAYGDGNFFYECRSDMNSCFTQYITEATVDQDRAYYSEKNMLRYIENPQSQALSTVRDVYVHSDSSKRIKNFILNDDKSMIFYIMDEQLHCHNLNSANSWCNNTSLYPYKSSIGPINSCGNQMTWKDSQTLFISNCRGEVLQYILPASG